MKYDREGFKSVSPRYNGVSGGKSMTSKALLTAFILGTVAFGGLTAKAADVDITNQAGLTNSANYANGNVLNIQNPFELTNASLPIINAANVVINGNGHQISGNIYAKDEDKEGMLQTGHYTISGNSILSLNNFSISANIAETGESFSGNPST